MSRCRAIPVQEWSRETAEHRARSPGELAQVANEAQPRRQGFAASTSWKRAGKLAVPAARDTTTLASSRGWRKASRTRWENSGSSSNTSYEDTVKRLAALDLDLVEGRMFTERRAPR